MTYTRLKSLLWPHTIVPITVVILIDYVRILGTLAQVLAGAYLAVQLLAYGVGFGLGSALHFKAESPWGQLFNLQAARFFPLLGAGRDTFTYLMSEAK